MEDFTAAFSELSWPTTLLFAWFAGEFGHRLTKLPRISIYGIVGFALASPHTGFLLQTQNDMLLLMANIAFGLILFEFGYRINLRWFYANPWMTITGLTEATCTFVAVYYLAHYFGLSLVVSLLLATLSVPTSPAVILRVINEQKSSGQVTERILHLSALNCVIAVFLFNIIVGFLIFKNSGSIWEAVSSSVLTFFLSILMGLFFGSIMPSVLRTLGRATQDSTVAFAITVIFLVALTHAFKLSPILSTLTFGFTARHRRLTLSKTQRNFGPLGDLFTVILFVFVATTLEWQKVREGVQLGMALVGVRSLAKIFSITLLAKISGISWRKGFFTGFAMLPISVFVLLILEHSKHLGVDLMDQLAPLATATLTLEILGPVCTQLALIVAKEVPDAKEFEHAS